MAILIDPPQWPAHDTLWSHLVSDVSYDELHAFATQLQMPRRSFDLDHYDIPASLYERAIALGARPVLARDIVHGLRESGLRVRQVERAAVGPMRRRQYLLAEWAGLAGPLGVGSSRSSGLPDATSRSHKPGDTSGNTSGDASGDASDDWCRLGHELIVRWSEAHRHYHDERHLEDVLLSLDHLATRGERVSSATVLAAWFHDAVYAGVSGADEQDSAQLATRSLQRFGLTPALVQQVSSLIVATTPATPHGSVSSPLAHLLDADLSIFASGQARYREYATAVRAEYAHLPAQQFREGRAGILQNYLGQPTIYRTATSQRLWEQRARVNLTLEVAELLGPTS